MSPSSLSYLLRFQRTPSHLRVGCLFATGLALFAMTSPLLAQPTKPAGAAGKQVPVSRELQIRMKMRYLIYLPEDYDAEKPAPLLLFLHGAGERGDNLDLVKVHGPPKLIAKGKSFPFIVVSPQCPKGQRWEPTSLLALLDKLEKEYAVDRSRVYVTGLSMGGFGTWALASYAPDRFAAIAPICGGGEKFWVRTLVKTPVWAFHGAKDNTVPIRRTEELVDTLKRLKGDVQFTVYPDAGHDSWTATYDNPKLYEWFLSHHR